MSKRQSEAAALLGVGLVGGAALQLMVQHEAAFLGLSGLELLFLGLFATALVTRLAVR